MPFSVCHYHVVWATKGRSPLLTPEIEQVILPAIRRKSADLKSPIFAINSTEDHIHIAVSISTAISVGEWAKGVKGVSAYAVNTTYPDLEPRFSWQKGYGVHTFGAKVLPMVVEYVNLQKEHHQDNTAHDYLEQCSP
jgi:putative transposase